MNIFKSLGIRVGDSKSLVREETIVRKGADDSSSIIRKGAGHSSREQLERQISKASVSAKDSYGSENLKNTHGENFHSDNDKECEKLQKDLKEVCGHKSLDNTLNDLIKSDSPKKKDNLEKSKYISRKKVDGKWVYQYHATTAAKREAVAGRSRKDERQNAQKENDSNREEWTKLFDKEATHGRGDPTPAKNPSPRLKELNDSAVKNNKILNETEGSRQTKKVKGNVGFWDLMAGSDAKN